MMDQHSYTVPVRFTFPEDEEEYPWLKILLEALYIIDRGIAEAIMRERQSGRIPACGKGCGGCCTDHKTIPVYPLELVGISWYAVEKLGGPVREQLKQQLKEHRENDPCPFLVDSQCAVYPVRPAACRQFIVFGNPCAPGEDAYHTRKEDVLPPGEYLDHAVFTMLPFYGIEDESDRMEAVESGAITKLVSVLQTAKWNSLAARMDESDSSEESG